MVDNCDIIQIEIDEVLVQFTVGIRWPQTVIGHVYDTSVDFVTGNSGVWLWRPCYAYAWLQAFKPIELRAPSRVVSLVLFFAFFIYY